MSWATPEMVSLTPFKRLTVTKNRNYGVTSTKERSTSYMDRQNSSPNSPLLNTGRSLHPPPLTPSYTRTRRTTNDFTLVSAEVTVDFVTLNPKANTNRQPKGTPTSMVVTVV